MATSDLIARFILQEVEEQGFAELRRASLAEQFSCVPSQINYVISTRFSPEHGYIVESRRGGGGYIRIKRVQPSPGQLIMHIVNVVGSSLELSTAAALVENAVNADAMDAMSAKLILASVSDSALRPVPRQYRDMVRASIFKQLLVTLIS